jgi:hypothetical protein
LEGLEITEITFRELLMGNDVMRMDADYFSKDALYVVNRLHDMGAVFLASLANRITDGIHTSLPFVENGAVKVLSAKHPKKNYIDLGSFETINAEFHAQNPRTALCANDVIVSTVGTIGNSAVVTEDVLPANSDRHIGIVRLKEGISPYFLSTFLLGKYGKTQTLREATGNVQLNLFISKIEQILVPRFSDYFEETIANTVKYAYRCRAQSIEQIEEAETTLLRALHLENWQAPEPLSYVRNSREAFAAGRFDAEHFQEGYYALHHILTSLSMGHSIIVNLAANLTNGAEIREYQEIGTPYLRVSDVKNLTIDGDSVVYVDTSLADEVIEKVRLQVGDVLVSRSGSLAITAVVEQEWTNALISSHLIRMRITDNAFDPYYVALFLKALPGRMQIIQWSNGGVQPEISQPSLGRIVIPYIPSEIQTEIRQSIMQSHKVKQRATHLLESAKRAVEIAIEQDEAAALDFLRDASFLS